MDLQVLVLVGFIAEKFQFVLRVLDAADVAYEISLGVRVGDVEMADDLTTCEAVRSRPVFVGQCSYLDYVAIEVVSDKDIADAVPWISLQLCWRLRLSEW